MKAQQFVRTIEALHFENVFNPYADRCPIHDLSDAPLRRGRALLRLLSAASQVEVDSLWIGRDLGYRGGRRTGLALTDDPHVESHAERWRISAERSTQGPPLAERTAAVVWQLLSSVEAPIFLWNVFPFHPHFANDPFSNRPHKPHERRVGEEILGEIIAILRPRRLVAIGNDAADVARRMSASTSPIIQIRHPSYGGQAIFARQVSDLYGTPHAQLALL